VINPDIVFLSGDIYDGPPIPFEAPINELASFKPKWGMYFVTGNHEEYGDRNIYMLPITKAGIRVLEDESVNVKGVNIAGVSYRNSSVKNSDGQEPFAFTLSKIFNTTASSSPGAPTILLKHTPAGVVSAYDAGISLMLSGHTHRGQMWPFGYIAKLVFNGFDYGLNKYKDLQVITTSGAGTWGPPQRIGTSNEVVVIKFKKS
jgi:predicted MPP superfamily phosphohydrolase